MSLECRHITVEHPAHRNRALRVLDRVEARFECGTISLISGPAGAGKSALLHVLGTLLRPTAGEIVADSQPVSRWKPKYRELWRRHVGILFQHLHLLPDLSMCDNILLPLVPRRISRSEKTERLGLLLEALALSALIDVPVQQLSGGQRQRAAMARAMISAPRYLLLDEPTSFQDDATVQSLVLYWQQAAQEGACVVICSHDLRLRRNGQIQQRFSLAQGALTRIA